MMYSDYFLLTVCALSVTCAPFLVIAQLRFAHVLQVHGDSNRAYFSWMKQNFAAVWVPLIGICLMIFAAERMERAFLSNTSLYQTLIHNVYIAVTLGLMAAVAFVFYRYTKSIKIEGEELPVRCTGRLCPVFWISSAVISVLLVLMNVFSEIDELVFFLPLFAPLPAALANAVVGAVERVRAPRIQLEQSEGD